MAVILAGQAAAAATTSNKDIDNTDDL